jgi:hypothetical protein
MKERSLGRKLLAIHNASIYTTVMSKSTENRTASFDSSLHALEQRHRALLAELADLYAFSPSVQWDLTKVGATWSKVPS